jgi:acyl-CoA synthetase (AMP-forming)/AMP-acid ligase II
MTPLFAIGGSIVLRDGFDAGELLQALRDYECRLFFGVPTIFKMLLDAPEVSAFGTGDLARCDEDGFFYIAGRSKDMIISGGVNIYPAEIEKEFLDHPSIAEVSVLGTSDEKWGEVPVAFVALKSGVNASDLELMEFLRPRINKIKLPRQIIFIEALPRNAYGKVLKLEQDRLRNDRLRNLKSS